MTIKRRFLFSVGANVARAGVSLIVGLLTARGLGPADYGNLAYLLGSFWAIRAFLDMGASSAFYTFIARRHRGRSYYLVYFGWLAFQFVLSVALVVFLLPSSVVERFWLGQERELILLALLATFLQNQVWQTVVQTHEAVRKTIRIQIAGMVIIVVHLLLVIAMLYGGWLSIHTVLLSIVAEYLLAAIWLSGSLRRTMVAGGLAVAAPDGTGVRAVLAEYVDYCKPMVVIAVFSSCYEMTDRWLLQNFGGAIQQGFYQVASQLSTISLLATTSILNILWKEVAEACERGDHPRAVALYQKTTRSLVLLATIVACFLAPWAEMLVVTLLGNAYHDAWPVLLVMLFYPICQAMGQVNGTFFMATGHTRSYMTVTVVALLMGIPISFLLIAPRHGAWLYGLGLGAMGLAIKTVGLSFIFVNIQSWMIARLYGAEFQWRYQVTAIVGLLGLAYAAHFVVGMVLPTISTEILNGSSTAVVIMMACGGLIYLAGSLAIATWLPGLVGLDRNDVVAILNGVKRGIARREAG